MHQIPPSVDVHPISLRRLALSRMSHRGGRNHGPGQSAKFSIYAPLVIATSAAATALAVNTQIQFSTATFAEITSLALLYDEVRVKQVKLHHRFYCTTVSATSTPSIGIAAIEFDAGFPAPVTSFGLLESQWHSEPVLVYPALGTNTGSQQAHLEKVVARPPAPLEMLTSSTTPGNGWFSIDSSNPIIAVVAAYASPLGAAGIISIAYFVELDIECRVRV